ncbi:MAG: hypothetical protein NTU80_13130 [Verrucomicrobia bacterium]|nr:hypothetical protein [Verrucomicrobiota bacterium]
MIYPTASNAALVFLKSQPTREQFLRRAGVRQNTYAAELVLNLYDDIFVHSKNLREEYLKYYKIEYPKFSEFADTFSSVPDSVMPKIDRYFQLYELIIHVCVPSYLEEDAGAETLGRLLRTKLSK